MALNVFMKMISIFIVISMQLVDLYAYNNIESKPVTELIKKADSIKIEDPLGSSLFLNQAIDIYLSQKDTVKAITTLFVDKKIHANLGRWHVAYKQLWYIILLAEEADLYQQLAKAYVQLGRLHGLFKRKDEAIDYINKAQFIIQKKINEGALLESDLILPYYAKISFFREIHEYEELELYLDSINTIGISPDYKVMKESVALEKAHLLIHKNKCLESTQILEKILQEPLSKIKALYVIVLSALVDSYICLGKLDIAKKEAERAIDYAISNNSHLDYAVLLYEKLSHIYEKKGQYKTAFHMSTKGNQIDNNIFDSRSTYNTDLFKLQDELRAFEEKQKMMLQEQQLHILINEEKLFSLKIWGLWAGLFLLSLIGIMTYRSQKEKQKSQTRLNQELQLKIEREEKYSQNIKNKNQDLIMFSNIMSHDLKAPLRTMHSFTSLVKRNIEQDRDKQKTIKYLNFISESATRMSNLVKDLLEYSKLEIKGLNLELLDLNEILDHVVPLFSSDLGNNKRVIEIGKLPTIYGDKAILRTVFHNLISNGLKYQPNEKLNHIPKIKIWSVQKDDLYSLFIQDNGIGIAKDYIDKLFVPFDRYYGSSEYEGTGLGLSICKKIMEKHSGDIKLHSTSEQGSIFEICFPIIQRA